MFVRKKKHRSGHVSVLVVDKSHGQFREIRTIGIAKGEAEIEPLCAKAREWIRCYGGQQVMDFIEDEDK